MLFEVTRSHAGRSNLFSRRAKNAAADVIRSRIATSEPTGLEPLLRGPTFAIEKALMCLCTPIL
jgi:hypothetical protein